MLGDRLRYNKYRRVITGSGILSILGFVFGAVALGRAYDVAVENPDAISFRYALFWAGIVLLFAPILIFLARRDTITRISVVVTIMGLSVASYLPKVYRSGWSEPAYYDEKIHIAHAQAILDTGQIFVPNSLNPPVSSYPVTQLLLLSIEKISPLSLYASGIVLLFIFHTATLVAIYALARAVGMNSRLSLWASVVAAIAPSFWFNGSQVSYQPIAFPFAIFALALLFKAVNINDIVLNSKRKSYGLYFGSGILIIVTIFTHHVTAMLLGGFMLLLAIVGILFKQPSSRNSIFAVFGFITIICSIAYYAIRNPEQLWYLVPTEAVSAIFSEGEETTGREAFTGTVLPVYEQISGYVGPLTITILVLVGLLMGGKVISSPWLRVGFAIPALLYPLSFPFTLIAETNVWAHRAWPFLYLAISLIAGAALAYSFSDWKNAFPKKLDLPTLRNILNGEPDGLTATRKTIPQTILAVVLVIIVAMGNAALDGNDTLRFKGDYVPGSGNRSLIPETQEVGAWIIQNYGEGTKTAGDTDTLNDLHLYGKIWVSKGFPSWGFTMKEEGSTEVPLAAAKILGTELFVVDTRLLEATKHPARGYYYDTSEPKAYSQDFPDFTLEKLEDSPWSTLVHVNGPYRVYQLNPEKATIDEISINKALDIVEGYSIWVNNQHQERYTR